LKKIIFTVTNDLNYDQRMQRISGSLAAAGYSVLLVGVKRRNSTPLFQKNHTQHRLNCWFQSGKLFYAEINIRLFFFLLFTKADCLCAIDLDTIMPNYLVSRLKGIKRVYDAHEYFSQLDEVISRPGIYRFWHWVERTMIPRFQHGYTVCKSLADEFNKTYGASYSVIRNVPVLSENISSSTQESILIYQGAVNKGRGLEKLVEAMQQVNGILWVCGDGNFMNEMKSAVNKHSLEKKIIFLGMLPPSELKMKTLNARVAINPFEKKGLNQYLSLSNKFFDFIHAELPQVAMNYPEYREINKEFEIALLIDDLEPATIADSVNRLFTDKTTYSRLKENCILAKKQLNWQLEESKLLKFYHQLFNGN
jgi:glycosyltransferase involved in cell wall biosynthesis